MTNNPTIDGVSPPVNCRQRMVAEGKPYPRSSCEVCGQFSPKWRECDALLDADKVNNRQMGIVQFVEAHPVAPAVERQEPVEKVDHPNFLEFAICDTCAAESLCCEVAPNEHLCGGCYWAPINEKAHADQVAALQSTIAQLRQHKNDYMEAAEETRKALTAEIAKLQARVQELESGRGEAVCYQARHSAEEPWFFTDKPGYWEWRPLFTATPAPVAVALPDGFMIVERSIWTEAQVASAEKCITMLKNVPGMTDRDLALASMDAGQCKAPAITLGDIACLDATDALNAPKAAEWHDVAGDDEGLAQ